MEVDTEVEMIGPGSQSQLVLQMHFEELVKLFMTEPGNVVLGRVVQVLEVSQSELEVLQLLGLRVPC
jgi:hypothetical protein